MRSFLIRDILSGGSASGGQANNQADNDASATNQLEQQQVNSANGSSFDAHTLASTQARFLAKLAEHQQQVQASKFYEQLQQHHHQLLNLNLNLNMNLSHHHHLQQHQQQQQQQQQQHTLKQLNSLNPCNNRTSSAASITSANQSTTSGCEKLKSSSFAYDCASPISSISEADRTDEPSEELGGGSELAGRSATFQVKRESRDDQERDQLIDEDDQERSQTGDDEDVDEEDEDEVDDDDEEDDEEIDVVEKATAEAGFNPADRARLREQYEQQQKQQQQQELDGKSGIVNIDQLGKQLAAPFQLNSPLDALFQMTSSTFDAIKRGEKRKGKFTPITYNSVTLMKLFVCD